MEQQQSSFKEKERIELREPRRFKVTIYNDDFTTMEFVVKVLTTVFYKSSVEAETLMLQVHKSNSAVVGIYSYDIAHSKVQKATRMARNEGFPLRLTVTPEPDTVLRVFMAWKPLDAPVEIEAQPLTAPTREGFTLVEWGGSRVD